MFDITPDDIARLDDTQLRALVGMLCEAELTRRGLPSSAVTWGGNQNAADGGLDVRVSLRAPSAIDGFVPRLSTGFQVKKQDMPRGAICEEMAPNNQARPVLAELAAEDGAYIIVSSEGSTSDIALQRRRKAMADAVANMPHRSQLFLDFYDRTRLASWVRCHAGIVVWVRAAVGRAIHGWEPFGAWAYPAAGVAAEFLMDEGVRIIKRPTQRTGDLNATQGLAEIRQTLKRPHAVVRLVGLSGVGKTRLIQALFDDRVGENALDPSLAVYTNMNSSPNPQPVSLASDLIASQAQAILIIDNCKPELHQLLGELAQQPTSLLSVLTVEYDVRDDQPEGTDVFELQVASVELIEKLLLQRFPALSQLDARTAATFAGGNARIAIALAATVERTGTLAGVSDDNFFQRLFVQRQQDDRALLHAAEVCALVYSYNGEDVSESGELGRLGTLIEVSADHLHQATSDLLDRDLAQQRGRWRAILPHAIANKLAAVALRRIPASRINAVLIDGAPERLIKSFARRLGYLHTSRSYS